MIFCQIIAFCIVIHFLTSKRYEKQHWKRSKITRRYPNFMIFFAVIIILVTFGMQAIEEKNLSSQWIILFPFSIGLALGIGIRILNYHTKRNESSLKSHQKSRGSKKFHHLRRRNPQDISKKKKAV